MCITRSYEYIYFFLSVQDEHAREEKKQSKSSVSKSSSKKRISDGELLQEALRNIPELNSHTPNMLDCRVTVQKLPESLTSALIPKTITTSAKRGRKQTLEEARANKYCFKCRKWFERPYKLQNHIKLVSISFINKITRKLCFVWYLLKFLYCIYKSLVSGTYK